jgi:hypothetical protein
MNVFDLSGVVITRENERRLKEVCYTGSNSNTIDSF